MRLMNIVLGASLALAAPALAQAAAMTPAEAIAAAAKAATGEVRGVFEFRVGSTGASGFKVFLNSDPDYRAPTNLTAELQPAANTELRQKLGALPQDVLTGKRVRITGTAHRVSIPKRDGTSYFQTRIEVAAANQIQILD
ncbi:hypothetical protein [Sphingomonas sp.]|uniref:hypothetical protein n=1 Tax=Sphingomonas sp. TaxID=28214 RepID=UPI001EB3739D|nr:hypothetical protein [Sphingomonas sp.]MBX3594016.1 hypothetical protein [Sphingomonas sp.]